MIVDASKMLTDSRDRESPGIQQQVSTRTDMQRTSDLCTIPAQEVARPRVIYIRSVRNVFAHYLSSNSSSDDRDHEQPFDERDKAGIANKQPISSQCARQKRGTGLV